jgi:hypothetical protein
MTEFIRGAWTADRMTLAPPATRTASNVAVKLASRSWTTNFTRGLSNSGYLEWLSMKYLLLVAAWAEPVPRAGLDGSDGRLRWLCWRGGSP